MYEVKLHCPNGETGMLTVEVKDVAACTRHPCNWPVAGILPLNSMSISSGQCVRRSESSAHIFGSWSRACKAGSHRRTMPAQAVAQR